MVNPAAATGEEYIPLLKPSHEELVAAPATKPAKDEELVAAPATKPAKDDEGEAPTSWTADGIPLGMGHGGGFVGEPMDARSQWSSGLFSCLGRNDDFCSSDLEVCLLGSFAPCVLYGSNAERLGSGRGTFANNCLFYTCLYMLGNSFFGWNCVAPWFSYPSRTYLRRRFNLEGSCEALSRSCGCCSSIIDDCEKREQMESTCDFMTHFFCHPCSLCQEGRELRRRLPHPGFNAQPIMVKAPPMEQRMGRGGM